MPRDARLARLAERARDLATWKAARACGYCPAAKRRLPSWEAAWGPEPSLGYSATTSSRAFGARSLASGTALGAWAWATRNRAWARATAPWDSARVLQSIQPPQPRPTTARTMRARPAQRPQREARRTARRSLTLVSPGIRDRASHPPDCAARARARSPP